MSAYRYAVHPLDVWGNDEDGYEVNDIYPSIGEVILRDDATDDDVLQALKRGGLASSHAPGCSTDIGETAGEPGDRFTVCDVDGKPALILECVAEVPSGYVECGCYTCMEGPIVGYPGDYCDGCIEAGCEHGKECQRDDAAKEHPDAG